MGKIFEEKDGKVRFCITYKSGFTNCISFVNIDEIEQFADELNAALIERDTYVESNDGWIENTGHKPDYNGAMDIKFSDGFNRYNQDTSGFRWDFNILSSVTHWRPAR